MHLRDTSRLPGAERSPPICLPMVTRSMSAVRHTNIRVPLLLRALPLALRWPSRTCRRSGLELFLADELLVAILADSSTAVLEMLIADCHLN